MYHADSCRYGGRMPYRRCGDSGLLLPAISLGLWHNFGHIDDLEEARPMMRRAFDRGITHFDLANNYGPPPGSAEENAGHILAGDFAPHRDELIISTKAGHLMWDGPHREWGSRKHLLSSLDQSLKRLRLDYVDIFYSHRPAPDHPPRGNRQRTGHRRPERQGTLRRHLEIPPEDAQARRQDARRGRSPLPGLSAVLLDPRPLAGTQ